MLNQNESELLSAYSDKELTGEELLRVQESLANSAEWREELKRINQAKTLAMGLPMMAAPVDLVASLERQAQALAQERSSFSWKLSLIPRLLQTWTWGGSLAAVALFAVFIGVHRVHEESFLPLEPLVAAHAHSPAGSLLQQNIIAASVHSNQHAKN